MSPPDCGICLGPMVAPAIPGGSATPSFATKPLSYSALSPPPTARVTAGCAHHFCFACLHQWIQRAAKPSCPTCRQPAWQAIRDQEFQAVCGQPVGQPSSETIIGLPDGQFDLISRTQEQLQLPPARNVSSEMRLSIGITLTDRPPGPRGDPQDGCMVLAVRRGNGAARAGIRAGDVILGINGMPIGHRGHAWAVELLERPPVAAGGRPADAPPAKVAVAA